MDFDIIVIGGSFAGMAAALQIGRARRRVLVIDAGEPRNKAAHQSHGFLGMDGLSPAEIMAKGRAEVLAYPTARFIDGVAERAARDGEGFRVALRGGESFTASKLVLAMGVADDLPDIPGLADRWGTATLHCPYCHAYELAGGRLGVLAQNEAAVGKARLIAEWGEVILFLNGAFDPDTAEKQRLAARKVKLERRPVRAIVDDPSHAIAVELEDGVRIGLDGIFLTPDVRLPNDIPLQLGCRLTERGLIEIDEERRTSVEGVYAAGDVAQDPHSATWAAAEGVRAGISAHQSLC